MFYRVLAQIFQTIGVLSTLVIGGIVIMFALEPNRGDKAYDFMSDAQMRIIYEGNKDRFSDLVDLSIPCNRFSRGSMHFDYPKICTELSDELSIYEYSFVNGNKYFYTNQMQRGFQKGFAYLKEEPEKKSELSFDNFPKELVPYEKHYHLLAGKWYIVAYNVNG